MQEKISSFMHFKLAKDLRHKMNKKQNVTKEMMLNCVQNIFFPFIYHWYSVLVRVNTTMRTYHVCRPRPQATRSPRLCRQAPCSASRQRVEARHAAHALKPPAPHVCGRICLPLTSSAIIKLLRPKWFSSALHLDNGSFPHINSSGEIAPATLDAIFKDFYYFQEVI